MIDNEVTQMINSLVKKYSYKPLDSVSSEIMRKFYIDHLPAWIHDLQGQKLKLFTSEGSVLCFEYDRVVVGDYGAFIEFTNPATKLIVEKGQEYRQQPRYVNNVKYDWLTVQDFSHIKIYYQKRTVKYADYKVGKYYVSPYEVFPRLVE